MSEEKEGPESGLEGLRAGIDPVAVALALGGASREEADGLLARQRRLIDLQIERIEAQEPHIAEEERLKLSHLRVRRFGDYSKMALEISVGLLVLALFAGVSLMVWNAAHAEGLVIESFSVPPDMGSKGIDGQVAASQLLDKLTAIQIASTSIRPAKTYANDWGDDLKVEIPETGVSIGEAYRFLRNWLGHETHVRGEIIRTAGGIAITTRTGNNASTSFAGPEDDLDALMQNSAEQIFRVIQPDRYARYLFYPRPGLVPRYDEARAVLNKQLAESGPAERGWAWTGLGVLASVQGKSREAAAATYHAIADNPDIVIPYSNLATYEYLLSHPEGAVSAGRKAAEMLDKGPRPDVVATFVATLKVRNLFLVTSLQGDYLAAAEFNKQSKFLPASSTTMNAATLRNDAGYVASLLHDGAAVRAWRSTLQTPEGPGDKLRQNITQLKIASALQDWRAVIGSAREVEKQAFSARGTVTQADLLIETILHPVMALAKARLGDIEGAQALIATTPGDCYDCVRIRGTIASEAKQWNRADSWFAKAVKDAPSIPFAHEDWGRSLLERGQPDNAIAQFKFANQTGPRFADPLEGWGEALMAKNQSHLALAKFAETEKYAPNWGRVHLKWGQALAYSGNKAEAAKHFARAAQLELTPSEKAELAGKK